MGQAPNKNPINMGEHLYFKPSIVPTDVQVQHDSGFMYQILKVCQYICDIGHNCCSVCQKFCDRVNFTGHSFITAEEHFQDAEAECVELVDNHWIQNHWKEINVP